MSSDQAAISNHPLVAFRYRNYRLFWIGNAFSNFGMWALTAGRLWLMHLLTDSTLMLGMVMFFGLGPILFFSMWGGVVADRVNRMKLVVKTRGVIAVLAIVTAFLIAFELIEAWHLLILAFLNGVVLSFDIPSRQAIIPNLVNKEHLMNAIVAQSFVHGAATVLGPLLFAPLMSFLDIEGVFFFIGTMYLLTVVFFILVDDSPHLSNIDSRSKPVLTADLIEGFRYMIARTHILSLMGLGIVVGFFGLSLGTLLPVFAENFGGGALIYSRFLFAMGIGGVIATFMLAFFSSSKNSLYLQLISGLILGFSLIVFTLLEPLIFALIFVLFIGMSRTIFHIINDTILQSIVEDRFRGRVMSIHMLGWGSSAIGGLLVGFIAQLYSPENALVFAGISIILGSLLFTFITKKNSEEF